MLNMLKRQYRGYPGMILHQCWGPHGRMAPPSLGKICCGHGPKHPVRLPEPWLAMHNR